MGHLFCNVLSVSLILVFIGEWERANLVIQLATILYMGTAHIYRNSNSTKPRGQLYTLYKAWLEICSHLKLCQATRFSMDMKAMLSVAATSLVLPGTPGSTY